MSDFIKKAQDLIFLALVIWRESRGESKETKIGVAFSILNRVRNPKWWGNDILSVTTKKWQYSSMTDPNDVQLTKYPLSNDPSWQECLSVAYDVYNDLLINPVKGADSYYDISLDKIGKAPNWATEKEFVKQLGKIKFYNLDRDVEEVKRDNIK